VTNERDKSIIDLLDRKERSRARPVDRSRLTHFWFTIAISAARAVVLHRKMSLEIANSRAKNTRACSTSTLYLDLCRSTSLERKNPVFSWQISPSVIFRTVSRDRCIAHVSRTSYSCYVTRHVLPWANYFSVNPFVYTWCANRRGFVLILPWCKYCRSTVPLWC